MEAARATSEVIVTNQVAPRSGEQRQRPARILFVTPRYYPYTGGVETHVAQVARRLAAMGSSVTVLTTDVSHTLPADETVDDVTIRRVRAWPQKGDYYFAPQIYRAVMQGHWDIVHVQSYHTFVAPLAMWAAWRARLPYVVTFHGGGHSSRWRNWVRGAQHWTLRPLFAHAARLVAVAEFETEFWSKRLQLPTDRFVLIPNGADLPSSPSIKELTNSDRTLLVSIGRLERYKGHQRAITALPYILQNIPDAHLWIAGSGPYESNLKQLAEKLAVAEHVEIRAVPPTERARLAQEISQATLVMLLSEYETHPIAVLEAAALGRPVLVTDTSGLHDLAKQGFATAIPSSSTPQQIAYAVCDVIRTPPAPPASINLPTWDGCAAQLDSLYHRILLGTSSVS